MIEINLLPESLREDPQSVTGMRFVLFLGVPILCILLFFWGWLHFRIMAQAKDEIKNLQDKALIKKGQAQQVEVLETTLRSMEAKKATADKLDGLRQIDWVRKLMDLTAAVNNTQGWITSIKLSLKSGIGTMSLKTKIKGRTMGELQNNVGEFLNSLGYEKGRFENGKKVFNGFWNGFIARTPEEYYTGIDKTILSEGFLIYELKLKLEILPEVAQMVSVGAVK